MAIYFQTNDPKGLLAALKKKIDDKRVITWSYDKDGDFTHEVPQWKHLAWLRPRIQEGRLALFIICPIQKKISIETYAIYHGRFMESMLAHCDSLFSQGNASAMVEGEDKVVSE